MKNFMFASTQSFVIFISDSHMIFSTYDTNDDNQSAYVGLIINPRARICIETCNLPNLRELIVMMRIENYF